MEASRYRGATYNGAGRDSADVKPYLERQARDVIHAVRESLKGAIIEYVPRYSLLIEWSGDDLAYLVTLPDWEQEGIVLGPVAHGDTYEEAVSNAREALDSLVCSLRQHRQPLPEPRVVASV